MRNPALVRKYAEGLAQALVDREEYGSVGAEVRAFLDLFVSREDLRRSLVSPFVNAAKKKVILGEVLARAGTGPKASRFLALLLEHKRLEILPDIVAGLPQAWADKHGVLTFEVTSAVPMTAAQQSRLARNLEASEKKPVRLICRIDPAVVGGLALRKGHIVYDASIEGQLTALKERLGHE
jgi:F-type H+-transporting ATPase subunit delta